ncbi:hypothetical protein TRICI_004606 [Trichomonascus ciferrii]|uniref:Uncharacterized protein n=1 Tax=Trichomonascus ciferrii TaxID=44093 RepID=A0A642V0F9_9ASCO|nr:hypothetical protein TRICI_004606 [Trichomonascus ciferrii]
MLPLNYKKKVSRISVLGLAAFPNPYDQCLSEGNKECSLEMQQDEAMMGGKSGTAHYTSYSTPSEAVNERVRRRVKLPFGTLRDPVQRQRSNVHFYSNPW